MNDDATFLNIENAAHSGAFGLNDQAVPSDAQCAAGNYKKGRVTLHGLALAIEQPRNSYRTGIDAKTGKRWVNRMAAHYGYICGTKGNDGDEVDCFIGPYPQSEMAYVINQNIGGRFDEHKTMLCFPDEASARRAYLDSYDRDWPGLASLVPVSIPQLKWWLKHGNMRRALRPDDLPHEGLEAMTRKVYWNSDAQPYDGTLDHILYDIRRSDAGENLLMDAVTAQDIMEDSDGELSLDALVSPYVRLERRMEILRGIMERTGDKVKPIAMQVTQPFKQRGVANVAAIFELSDGQTVSIYFHSPDTTPGKMAPTDEVISWKWLLNKKDITIVVAPERGADLNVREVARRIVRLAEKNSAAFTRANAKRAERMQTIADLKTETAQLEGELKSAQNELEVAKLEWEEAQERAKAQTSIESDEEDDDRPLSAEERAAIVQRARNSHTIGVADPDEPESNEEVRNINGTPTIVVNTAKTGKAANGTQPDLSYRRSADGLFTSFYPNTPAGKKAWETMNATPGGERGKVLVTHTEAVIQQLRDAGYTVAKDTTPAATPEEIDFLAKGLEEQASTERALINAYIKTHGEEAAQINAAVAAVNWEDITDSKGALAEAERLFIVAEGSDSIAAAQKALHAAGIHTYENRVSDALNDSPEYRAWIEAGKNRSQTHDKLLDTAKAKLIEEGKAELAALPDDAPLVDVSRAIFRKRGINIGDKVPSIVTDIEAQNADGVWSVLRNLDNKASAEIFEHATGIKLAKTQRDRRPQIDAWAGITPEQRAEKEATQDAAWRAEQREKSLKRAWQALANFQVRTQRWGDGATKVVSGQEYLQMLFSDGYDEIVTSKKGAVTSYYVLKGGSDSAGVNSKNFNGFMKAALAWGGLRQALKTLGVVSPEALNADAEKIAAVDAVYSFASASDGFKLWLHESLNKLEQSPFATARAMDEAAKRHGATIEWGQIGAALDDVGHSVASLQASLAVVEKQAQDHATGIEAEAAASIREAIAALDDDDYAPSEEEFGAEFEAETDVLDSVNNASEPPLKALLMSLRSFLGQQTALDAAQDEPDCVGKIKRNGEVVGRIDIADNGDARVFVGAVGVEYAELPSGTFIFDHQDAALIIDALFAARDQSPETGAFGEIFHGYTNQPEAAIDKIMAEKRGEVPDAFVHPELGNITFVYGDERMGLRHIELKHPEMLERIPDILRTGRLVRDDGSVPRAYIVQDGNPAQLAVLRLAWDGEQKTWLVTAHEDDVGRFSRHDQEKSPDALPRVIPEQPTHTGNPVVDPKVVAGQRNNTTSADTLPEKIPGTRAVAARMDNADLWLLETLKELGDLTDEQAQIAAQYFIKHKLAKLDMPMSRYNFKHGSDLEREFIRSAAGITDTPTGATKGKDEFTIGSVKLQAFTAKSHTGSRVWGVRVLENGKEINAANGDGGWFKHDTKASMIDNLERMYAAGMAHSDKAQNENHWREAFGLPPLGGEQPESTATEQARALFQSVIDGTVPDILAPELADEMEAAYLPVQGDPEIEALFERAVGAYQAAMLAATENLS